MSLAVFVRVVVEAICVEAGERIEPPGGRCVLPVAEPKVPLAHQVSLVAQVLQALREESEVLRDEGRGMRLHSFMLEAHVERVEACEYNIRKGFFKWEISGFEW